MKNIGTAAGRLRSRASSPLVVVFAGTRPEAIKLAPVLWELRGHPDLRVTAVNSGQHAGAVRDTLAEFGILSDIELDQLPALPNLAAAFEHLRVELRAVVARARATSVVVQGDTLTAYAGAQAARDAGCEIAHIEAGLRTESVSDPFPEEWFRRRIARIADLHFAPTHAAVDHLRAEGIADHAIHRTGNTGIDSLKWLLGELAVEGAAREPVRDRILVTLHRRENYDRNADTVCRALIRLSAARPDLRMTFPVHPNPRVSGPIRRRLGTHAAFDLVAPMAYRDFIRTAAGAALIISDSGGIQEESPHLGTPLLVPRCNTERPEGIATGFVRLVAADENVIVREALRALAAPRAKPLPFDEAAPFGAGDAAQRIVRILEGTVAERAYA